MMQHADLPEQVKVHTDRLGSRLISDSELAAMPPSPRRAPAMVAARATAKANNRPRFEQPARPYPAWPFLIVTGAAVLYLAFAAVIR